METITATIKSTGINTVICTCGFKVITDNGGSTDYLLQKHTREHPLFEVVHVVNGKTDEPTKRATPWAQRTRQSWGME